MRPLVSLRLARRSGDGSVPGTNVCLSDMTARRRVRPTGRNRDDHRPAAGVGPSRVRACSGKGSCGDEHGRVRPGLSRDVGGEGLPSPPSGRDRGVGGGAVPAARPRRRRQDPADWWDAVVRGTRCVLGERWRRSGRGHRRRRSSQWSGTVPVDDQGRPGRPATEAGADMQLVPPMPPAEWQETKDTLASLLPGGGQDPARRERPAEPLVERAVSPHRQGKHPSLPPDLLPPSVPTPELLCGVAPPLAALPATEALP